METKFCTKCKQELPVENFYKAIRRRDGYAYWCKNCHTVYVRARYAKNPQKTYTRIRAWRIANPQKANAYCRIWKTKNPIKTWVAGTIRGHRRRGFDVRITPLELMETAQKAVQCVYCGVELDWSVGKGKVFPNSPTLDRIHNGKVIDGDSVQILCSRCNVIKGNEYGEPLMRRLQAIIRSIQLQV